MPSENPVANSPTPPPAPEDMLPASPAGPRPLSPWRRFIQWYGKLPFVVKWSLNILNIVFGTGFIIFLLSQTRDNLIDNRCKSFPVAYEFVRQITCPRPVPGNLNTFRIVLARLSPSAEGNLDADSLDSAYTTLEEIFNDSLMSDSGVGRPATEIISYNGSPPNSFWVERVRIDSSEQVDNPDAQRQLELFQGDIIIYGTVTNTEQGVIFEPLIDISQRLTDTNSAAEIYTQDIKLIRELQAIEFVPGVPGDTLTTHINTLTSFITALNLLSLNNDSPVPGDGKTPRQQALEVFESISGRATLLRAQAAIYAGNIALEEAIAEQQNAELACPGGLCVRYEPPVIEAYRRAWNNYAQVLESDSEDLRYRALIGRGNVHYRLSRITFAQTRDIPGETLRYDCVSDDLLLLQDEEADSSGESLNWLQRGRAALRCYEQAAYLVSDNSEGLLKIRFGEALVQHWLAIQGNISYEASLAAYTAVIDLVPEETNPNPCLLGIAYGERAQIQWLLANQGSGTYKSVEDDLNAAIRLLSSETCNLARDLARYENDVAFLPSD